MQMEKVAFYCCVGVWMQVVVLKNGPKHVDCAEDEDFMAAFDKMIEDTSKARNSESIKVPQFDVPVPVGLKGVKKKFG